MWLQVPLLLSIGEEDSALTKATDSGDTDLVYFVLFHIWHKVTLGKLQVQHYLTESFFFFNFLFWLKCVIRWAIFLAFGTEASIGLLWDDSSQTIS